MNSAFDHPTKNNGERFCGAENLIFHRPTEDRPPTGPQCVCGRGENPRQAASDTEDGEANDAYFEADDHGRTASTSPRRGVHQGSSSPHAIVCLFRSTFTPLHSIPLHSPLHYTPHSVI